MRERPILMNGESVRATLEGRKTQMRWEITPQPVLGRPWKNWIVDPDWMDLPFAYCPYGIPRDRLWVREAFSYITLAENEFVGEGDQRRRPDGVPVLLLYKADADAEGWTDQVRWYPSIHRPRWALRLRLEIVGVRVERVPELSEEDACAEGGPRDSRGEWVCTIAGEQYTRSLARARFAMMWDGRNSGRGLGWEANPWVWVVKFKRDA